MRNEKNILIHEQAKTFFKIVSELLDTGEIVHGKEVQVTNERLRLHMPTIMDKYRKRAKRSGISCIDNGSFLNFLETSIYFNMEESEVSGYRFTKHNNPVKCKVFNLSDIIKDFNIHFKITAATA